jgi:hypothetical protein
MKPMHPDSPPSLPQRNGMLDLYVECPGLIHLADTATAREYRELIAILSKKIDQLEQNPKSPSLSTDIIFWKSMRDDLYRLETMITDLCGPLTS